MAIIMRTASLLQLKIPSLITVGAVVAAAIVVPAVAPSAIDYLLRAIVVTLTV